MAYKIRNAYIITADEKDREIPNGCVHIEDGFITYVGNSDAAPDLDCAVIDAGGKLLIPGLINTHTHLAMTLLRGAADDLPLDKWLNDHIWPMEAQLTQHDIYWGTLLAAAECFRFGVTCVNDMYGNMDKVADAMLSAGLRGVLSAGLMDAAPGAQKRIDSNMKLYQDYDGAEGLLKIAMGPHAQYTCSNEYLSHVAGIAREKGMPLHIHISETAAEHENCKKHTGFTPIGLLNELGILENNEVMAAHCVWVEPEDIELMAKHNTRVLHCPGSNAKLASGIAPIPDMLSSGIAVGLATDGASSSNNLDMLAQIKNAALLHKAVTKDAKCLPALKALKMGTIEGAGILGLELITGSIECGKSADLVMIDTNQPHFYPRYNMLSNLVYSAVGTDVCMTMINGNIVYQNGEYPTIDLARVITECENIARKLS